MKTVSMLDFRNNSEQIISWAKQGLSMVMTYRGKPVMRLEPIKEKPHSIEDPFYRLADMAEKKGGKMSNKEMDKLIYGA